jgi:cellobiose phosphorylase
LTPPYANRFGAFSADGWQYEIVHPDTPRRWENHLINRTFRTAVSQTGMGASARVAPAQSTLSRPHRAFYLRDRETGEFWSPTGAPAGGPLVLFRCVHRPDCTVIESERAGIACRLRVFVPVEGDVAIWTVTLRNHTVERRRLSLFAYVPMFGTGERGAEQSSGSSSYDAARGAMVVEAPGTAALGYLASQPVPTHTEGSTEAFVGGADRWDRPAAVEAGRLSDGPGRAEDLAAALQHDLVLDDGASWTVHLAVGAADTRDEVPHAVRRFTDPDGIEALFEECWLFWQNAVGAEWVATPDNELNLMLNVWLKRQLVHQVMHQGERRTAEGGIEVGLGEFRIPNSEFLQDAVGYLPCDAGPLRRALRQVSEVQESSGALPCALPVWFGWALAAYANETGDAALLAEALPFRDKKKPVSVLEHAVAGLRFTAGDVGQHGLCRSGSADHPSEGGESVLTSLGVVFAARALAPVAAHAGPTAAAQELAGIADTLSAAVNASAWDGAWYIRGYTGDRQRFGAHGESEGRIHLSPQSWAVLAGVADPERADLAMQSVQQHLETDGGTAALAPPYSRYIEHLGPMTQSAPGTAANGAVNVHAAVVHACALAALGHGGRAVERLRTLLPTVRQHPVERARHLPIWMPSYYVPPTAEPAGRASTTYRTAGVPWCFLFIRDYLFGARATPEGLVIRPTMPASWREARLVRPFRGDVYEITLQNPEGLETGRVRLTLDGRPIEGDLIRPVGDGRHHQVAAIVETVRDAASGGPAVSP